MLGEDLFPIIPHSDLQQAFTYSIKNGHESIIDIDVLDYIYQVQCVELRPRIYKGDFGERLWCVEVYDWSNNESHVKNLVGFHTREEAVHKALVWYFSEYSVKNG